MTRYYTGVGSRKTPLFVQEYMSSIAGKLYKEGWTLRSGGAEGADKAFEKGIRVDISNLTSPYRIYLPWDGFNNYSKGATGVYPRSIISKDVWEQAERIARKIHPYGENLKQGALSLHTRNVFQILGEKLDKPSKFVIFWAPEKEGVVEGGTATAVNLARSKGIPTFNLANKEDEERILKWLS